MKLIAKLLEEFKRCREGFLDGFSTAELVAIYRAYVASESCRLPDTWSREQVALALDGHPPDWHDDGAPDLTALKLCRLTAEEAERVQSLYERYPQEARDVDASLFRKGWVRAAVDAGRGVQLSRAALGQRELPEGKDDPPVCPFSGVGDEAWNERWLVSGRDPDDAAMNELRDYMDDLEWDLSEGTARAALSLLRFRARKVREVCADRDALRQRVERMAKGQAAGPPEALTDDDLDTFFLALDGLVDVSQLRVHGLSDVARRELQWYRDHYHREPAHGGAGSSGEDGEGSEDGGA